MPVAQAFSRQADDPDDRFAVEDWASGAQGVPLLRDALVSFACRVVQSLDCGSHTVFVGEILEIRQRDQRSLLYKSGEFLPA